VVDIKIHLYYKNKISGLEFQSVFGLVPIYRAPKKKVITKEGSEVEKRSYLVCDLENSDETILNHDDPLNSLANSEIELDLKEIGKPIEARKRIIIDKDFNPVYSYERFRVFERNGKVTEEPYREREANVNNASRPLLISRKRHSKEELFEKYVFKKNYYIKPTETLQFKPLYGLAKELASNNKMAEIIAFTKEKGKRMKIPIIIKKGGKPYHKVFLEGRIELKKERFSLILHLTDMELKPPQNFLKTNILKEGKE
jgi:hypothetical protein